MALKRSTTRSKTFGGGGTTTIVGGTASSTRMGLEEYVARLEESHRLQVERANLTATRSMGAFFAREQVSLSNKRDTEALDRIGKGDAAYGMTYAKRRIAELEAEGDDDGVNYWTDIFDRAKERAEDDYIAGLVQTGEFGPRDILPILQKRRDQAAVGSPGYLALSKQIGEVTGAIKAEEFNAEVAKAQASFTKSGDRQALMEKFISLFGRSKDATTRTMLNTRITNLQKEIDNEAQVRRQSKVTEKVLAYQHNRGTTTASEVLFFIAAAGKDPNITPEEQSKLISLAQSISANERAIASAARAAGGGGGGGGSGTTAAKAANDVALRDERANLKNASGQIKDGLLDRGKVPTADEWAIYWAAGDNARTALEAAIAKGGVTEAAMTTLTNEYAAVEKTRKDYKDAAAANVVARSAYLQGAIDRGVATAKAQGMSAAEALGTVSGLLTELQGLTGSTYLAGDEGRTAAVRTNIEQALAPVRKDFVDSGADLRDTSRLSSIKALDTKYQQFLGSYADANNGKAPPAELDFNGWLEIMANADLTPQDRASQLGLYSSATGTAAEKFFTGGQASDALAVQKLIKDAETERTHRETNLRAAAKIIYPERGADWSVNELISGYGPAASNARIAAMDAGRPEELKSGLRRAETATGVLMALLSEPMPAQPQGYDQPAFDNTGGGGPPPQYGQPQGYDQPMPTDGSELGGSAYNAGIEDLYRQDTAHANEVWKGWEPGGRLDESERSYIRLTGSQQERSAYDYLDSTIDLSYIIPEATVPDEVEEFPFLIQEHEYPSFDIPSYSYGNDNIDATASPPSWESTEPATGYDRPTITE